MKCKYNKECKHFDPLSVTCWDNGGMYYEDMNRPAGCYRRMEKKYENKKEISK